MKITDAHGTYNQISQVSETSRVNRTEISENSAVDNRTQASQDTVSLSRTSREFQMARNAVDASPEVRTELVERLKAAVETGQYQADPEKIAEKIMQRGI